MKLTQKYWETRYENNETGWDLGEVSPPLKAYIDQLTNEDIKILIPGAGNSYEAEYLHQLGFKEVFVVDLANAPLANIKQRVPSFPSQHLIQGDFFALNDTFDLILEQTFFCALAPSLREQYVKKMHQLLVPNGRLVGLFFQVDFQANHPPFGGSKEEYISLFQDTFHIHTLTTAYNSIVPRQNKELFLNFKPINK